MDISGPVSGVSEQCEKVLRTLPLWFGIESSLLMYARDAATFPTFVARVLQVKTLAETHPSAEYAEYAETRRFYASIGYTSLEVFPELWGKALPVLQLVKALPKAG